MICRAFSTLAKHVGERYEEQVIRTLTMKARFQLEQTQSSHDKGIDFRGTWNLPSGTSIQVIGQCKCEKNPVGTSHLRDFEGVLAHHYHHDNHHHQDNHHHHHDGYPLTSVMGIVASRSGFSDFALGRATETAFPVILCCIREFSVLSFVMNHRAKKLAPMVTVHENRQSHLMQLFESVNGSLVNLEKI